jgi:hypothetical protein
MTSVDRAHVMAYRMRALGLATRGSERPGDLPVLDVGIQEYTPGSVQVALAARTTADFEDDRLIMVWAARGAPHLLRRADLATMVKQLWPVSDADASARINSAQIPDGVKLGIEAFRVTASAFREVLDGPMPRGEVSTEVSKRVPRSLTYDCRTCKARHIAGNVWQHSGLAGGVEVVSRGKDAMLAPIKKAPPQPTKNAGIGDLITTYLRYFGPATPLEVGKYLGSTTAEMKKVWPSGVTKITADGREAWLPESAVEELTSAARVSGVRLIPPMDPFLQARDRDLLVPDRAHQKEVWRVLGNPGAVLVDGEVAGVWRAKMAGRKRVDLTVTQFTRLSATHRKKLETESAEVARGRGVADVTVNVE